jgi:hypothetical protein
MFFEDVIRLDNTVNLAIREQFTGTFHTNDKWGTGDLELILSERGILTGSFILEEITFGVKGQLSHTGIAFGYLLEPDAAIPIAMLRIQSRGDGLGIDIVVPELDELLGEAETESVLFSRVVATPGALEELLIGV